MNVVFTSRKTAYQPIPIPPGMTISIERYSRAAVGGCKTATLQVQSQSREDLYELLNWLMAKAVIADDTGRPVWWGYLGKVEIQDGPMRATADLDWMANRIAVAYTTVAYGEETVGARATTAWLQDVISVEEFGIKELLYGRGGMTATLAEALRARLLSQMAFPTAVFESNPGEDTIGATLTLRGWWSTLEWRYAAVPTRLALGFETIGSLAQTVGAVDVVGLAQSFDVSADINLQDIDIYLSRTGTPAEDLTVAIYENPDDLTPGAQLASTAVTPTGVPTTAGWVRASLSSPLALTAGSTYFLVVSTTELDPANCYNFTLDGALGYGAGVLRQKISTAWGDGPAGDMPFRLYANDLVETSQQIKSLIANYGQFLQKVFTIASGIETESYRGGDNDARMEIEDLLDAGTDSNLRMFADVDMNRNVTIWEQPTSASYVTMDRQGAFRDEHGNPLDAAACPVGMWVMPDGIVPSNVDVSLLMGVQKFLVEETEYDVSSGRLNPTPANIDNPWDFGVAYG